jgi:hypothetical protein
MMRSSHFFWGGVLVLLGGIFLVDSLGIVTINIWGILWPVLLILFGLWVLMGYFLRGEPAEGETASVPLDGARSARINIQHGAGRLTIGAGAGPMELVSGTFGGGLNAHTRQDGDKTQVTLRVRDLGFPMVIFPWFWGPHNMLEWNVSLTDEIPLELKLNTGASDTRLNLTDLQITSLWVETGASATEIHMPDSAAFTKAVIKAGAASVNVRVPDGVAARIRVSGGLMSANVDTQRFPKSGGYYQSSDYETAPFKAEIRVETGVGSVTVR